MFNPNSLAMKHSQIMGSLCLIFLFFLSVAQAQVNEENPLQNNKKLISEEEIVLSYTNVFGFSGSGTASELVSGIAYDIQSGNLTETNRISTQGAAQLPYDPSTTALASGDFFGDDFGEGIVHAFKTEQGNQPAAAFFVELRAAFDGNPLPSSASPNIVLVGSMNNGSSLRPRISMASGNFDNDPQDELAIAYHGSSGAIEIAIYDISLSSGGGQRSIVASLIHTETGNTFDNDGDIVPKGLAIDVVDFNVDGRDELAVAYEKNDGLSLDVFHVDSLDQFRLKHRSEVFRTGFDYCSSSSTSFNSSNLSLDIAAGDLNSNFFGEELAMVAHYGLISGTGSPGNNEGLYVFPLRESEDEMGMVVPDWCPNSGDGRYYSSTEFHFRDDEIAIDVETGDLDGDLDDEIVVGTSPKVFVLDVNFINQSGGSALLTLDDLGSIGLSAPNYDQVGEAQYADNFLAVGNVDPLEGNFGSNFRAEVVVAKNFPLIPDPINSDIEQYFEIKVYGFEESGPQGAIDFGNPVIKAERTQIDFTGTSAGLGPRSFSIAMVDQDGGSVYLGRPTRTDLTEVLNPLLILNAPPTHFDVFGSNSYDLCNLYPTGETNPAANIDHFQSIYRELTQQSFSFSAEFTTDWAVSKSVEAGFAASGFSLGGKFENTYGERFSKVEGSSREVSIIQQRNAGRDDELLAYLVDYSIFEYPVFRKGDDSVLTHAMVVLPGGVKEAFTGVRSSIHRYQLSHQHGNLFSYPEDESDLFVNPGASAVYKLSSQEISKNSGFNSDFTILQSDATSQSLASEVRNETTVGVNAGGAFKGFGLSASVEGTYSETEIETRTSRYQRDVEIQGIFGKGEDLTIPGDYPYFLTPLMYWDENGSLVLNYLVDIQKQGFWQTFYDGYDPAFLLLDPHKPEKGIEDPATYNNADRYLTRDIIFSGRAIAGDSIDIRARIHNYGFQGTPQGQDIDICFYYLDPSGTDTLESIGCTSVNRSLLGRDDGFDFAIVDMPWNIPANLGPNTKVVAIIDPKNDFDQEIHDYPRGNGVSNNIGWTCLFNPNCGTPSDQAIFFPDGLTSTLPTAGPDLNVKAFPNPFKDQLTLGLYLDRGVDLQLSIYDLQGREVHSEKVRGQAGAQSLRINSTAWPEGMYIYQVKSSRSHTSGKILLRR